MGKERKLVRFVRLKKEGGIGREGIPIGVLKRKRSSDGSFSRGRDDVRSGGG